MRITNIARWLLATLFLAGCIMAAASLTAITGPKMATATVAALTDAPVLNGGGLTNDEPTVPAVSVAAATTVAPLLTIRPSGTPTMTTTVPTTTTLVATTTPSTVTLWSKDPHPLQIEMMRQQSYPGSPITIEQTLEPGSNYNQYVVSYLSDGYKIYALMSVPTGTKPTTGWPAIVFNHGYISPSQYRTTERYVAYVDTIARNGYIVFKSDYRGHGSSEGDEVIGGGYGTPAYTADVLNAVASLQAYEDADPHRIGMWGHSMGGQLTLRAMVVTEDIKAGAIWGGVVPPYPDIIERWDFTRNPDRFPWMSTSQLATPQSSAGNWLQDFSSWVNTLTTKYGGFNENPTFWAAISPNNYLEDLSGPIQLHHSTTDEMVPAAWAETLAQELEEVDHQPYELYTYPGDNHNISANFGVAMQRTVAFFDQYVKGQ